LAVTLRAHTNAVETDKAGRSSDQEMGG